MSHITVNDSVLVFTFTLQEATHFRYAEKVQAGVGSITQRLGADSQQPFGHCCLSLAPVEDAVMTPSGHIYEREAILEYLLMKTKELKKQARLFEQQQQQQADEERAKAEEASASAVNRFVDSVEGVSTVVKRKASEVEERNRWVGGSALACVLDYMQGTSIEIDISALYTCIGNSRIVFCAVPDIAMT
jgi:hypothetical protein